jgi:sec-independent protein translocase protein TatA
MGADSLWHWLIVIVVVLLLFGRGKVSEFMGDIAHGIKGFKKAMAEPEDVKEDIKSVSSTPGPDTQDHVAKTHAAEQPTASD